MTSTTASVCVVIAAKNAEATIARAVGSALRDPWVTEVVVVDDGSSDATASAAGAAAAGSDRLRLIKLPENRGPSFARNRAIAESTAPFIAILDADDFLLKGRFDALLGEDDWDFVADNIVFVDARTVTKGEPMVPQFEQQPRFLDLPSFVEGNISRRGASRGEIGFLKPVMRRSFLEVNGLAYREDLRLGEDYDLYVRALARGARFKTIRTCGYCAVVRPDSLSGQHRTEDLRRLYQADRAILAGETLTGEARSALGRHASHLRGRYELRRFLDVKARAGLAGAGLHALSRPRALPAIVRGIAADKLEAARSRGKSTESTPSAPRYLLNGRVAKA